MRTLHFSVMAATLCVSAAGCDYTRDTVGPGYYGDVAGRAATPAADSGSSDPRETIRPGRAAAGSPSAAMSTERSSSANSAQPAAPPVPKAEPASCDLTGRWLLTLHKTTDGLGNLQYIHNYLYYEISQQAESLTVTKSLQCGTDAVGGGAFAVAVDYSDAAAGVMARVSHDGRKGHSVNSPDGCQIELEKQYTVAGATLPYYLDPSTTLPSADDMAADEAPGWEDWDNDGNPGITGVCQGTVSGKLFTAARDWVTLSGSTRDVSSAFTLRMEWDQEQNVMAFEGSPFLRTQAVRAADPKLHFAQFARLTDAQAAGDDAMLCKRLVELAPTLTPEAAGM